VSPLVDASGRRARYRQSVWALIVLFVGLAARLLWLQVVMTTTYRRLSEENRARMLTIQAPRGSIRDRYGEPLANDVVRSVLVAADSTISYDLSPLVGSPTMVEPAGGGIVVRDLTSTQVAVFEESWHLFPGLRREGELARRYSGGEAFSHVVGYLGEISRGELAQRRRYRQGDLVGQSGIEKVYEGALRGRDGWEYVEVDARGSVIGPLLGKEPVVPTWGKDVTLSLDADLQREAYRLLREQGRGAIVALDPRSGEVLALVSSPGFDPNLFGRGMSPPVWRTLHQDPGHPLLSRATQSAYPPGSVFKLVVASCALEEGLLAPGGTLRPCRGALRYGRRTFRCWKEEGHGHLDVVAAIEQSCDVFFYQIGLELGLESMSSHARSMGLGVPTNIEVVPEAAGLIPTKEWYDNRFGPRGWTSGVLLNLAIGQGELLVTPLQAARYVAALANDGVMPVPHLVVAMGGKPLPEPEPSSLPISRETLRTLREAAEGVVEDPQGTAHGSMLRNVRFAGKTGTAQNPGGEDHSWFVCYAPVHDPQLALAVIVENAGHGSKVAAPLAARLVQYHLIGATPQAEAADLSEFRPRRVLQQAVTSSYEDAALLRSPRETHLITPTRQHRRPFTSDADSGPQGAAVPAMLLGTNRGGTGSALEHLADSADRR
jgi:penicillin-binding protein 2